MSLAPSWRGRVAKGALLIGALVVGGVLARAYPRDVALRYDLGRDHDRWVEARLTYSGKEGELAGVTFREPGGIPERLDHEVQLSPGHYRVSVTLIDGEGQAVQIERPFDVPSEGVTTIRLETDR